MGDSYAKVAAQLRVYVQEKSYCFQMLCESRAKVANGVDLPIASRQHVKDNKAAPRRGNPLEEGERGVCKG